MSLNMVNYPEIRDISFCAIALTGIRGIEACDFSTNCQNSANIYFCFLNIFSFLQNILSTDHAKLANFINQSWKKIANSVNWTGEMLQILFFNCSETL